MNKSAIEIAKALVDRGAFNAAYDELVLAEAVIKLTEENSALRSGLQVNVFNSADNAVENARLKRNLADTERALDAVIENAKKQSEALNAAASKFSAMLLERSWPEPTSWTHCTDLAQAWLEKYSSLVGDK